LAAPLLDFNFGMFATPQFIFYERLCGACNSRNTALPGGDGVFKTSSSQLF